MKLFLDTNILLDLLLKRAPYDVPASHLFSLADKGKLQLYVSTLTVANANYSLSKLIGSEKSRALLLEVCVICSISPMNEDATKKALLSAFNDVEDAMQYHSAVLAGADIIITRDTKDYKQSALPVMSASEFLAWYDLNGKKI
ncbi:twitching motility protein PilT [Bacteroidia bacterium]|nr:twitching motility protein PilT [Bacteroidia bacterium]